MPSLAAPHIQQATEFILVSPYFVRSAGADALCVNKEASAVRILTNSPVSTTLRRCTLDIRYRKQSYGAAQPPMNSESRRSKAYTTGFGLSVQFACQDRWRLQEDDVLPDRSTSISGLVHQRDRNPFHSLLAALIEARESTLNRWYQGELVNRENGSKSLKWTGPEDGRESCLPPEPYAGF